MGKTSVRKRIKQFWQALTIKKKIATFTGTVFLIIAVSVLFNVWVVKFSLIDFNRILQDNAAVSELAQALEEESIQFERKSGYCDRTNRKSGGKASVPLF